MERDSLKTAKGLAKRYAIRRSPSSSSGEGRSSVTYYSTSSLKGGKHTYSGNVVTRNAKTGEIVSVTKITPKTK